MFLKALNYALINGRAIASISAFSMCQAALEETLIYECKKEVSLERKFGIFN